MIFEQYASYLITTTRAFHLINLLLFKVLKSIQLNTSAMALNTFCFRPVQALLILKWFLFATAVLQNLLRGSSFSNAFMHLFLYYLIVLNTLIQENMRGK